MGAGQHDQQTLPLQLETMREFADKRGWTIEIEIEEIASGAINNSTGKSR